MTRKLSCLLVLLAVIAICSNEALAYLSTDWTREDVNKVADTQGDCGWYTSLALDAFLGSPRNRYGSTRDVAQTLQLFRSEHLGKFFEAIRREPQ